MTMPTRCARASRVAAPANPDNRSPCSATVLTAGVAAKPCCDQDDLMDHITFVPSPDQFAFTFGGADPVLRIKAPTVLTLWTEDAYGGRITSADDVASSALDT